MSGFDVKLADAQRSRALTFFTTVSLGLAIVLSLLMFRSDGSSDAVAAVAESNLAAASPERLTEDQSEAAVILTGMDLVEAQQAMFFELPALQTEQRQVQVRSGQTFASVLDNAGAGRVEAARAIAALEPLFPARDLRAGQDLNLYFETVPGEDTSRLAGLSFRPDSERTLTVSRVGEDQFRAREATVEFTRELVRMTGTIESNFYTAALDAGGTDKIIYDVANVLGYAVDFRLIQAGDSFDVLFERYTTPRGETARTGDVLYVNFDGRGDALEYFRYETPYGELGYYSGDGESAQRLLMKTPINGARLSSHFGRRFHPILRTSRPHNGTDFAAPRGTPIMAAGNGIVERANRYGSFGNYIRIRHSNGFQTAYAHLNGFARGIRAGSRVTQGQIIGYVGTTGRSTGPHLHYEVHLNGNPLNPMSLNLPVGRQLNADEIPVFTEARDEIIALRDAAPNAAGEPEPDRSAEPTLVAHQSSNTSAGPNSDGESD